MESASPDHDLARTPVARPTQPPLDGDDNGPAETQRETSMKHVFYPLFSVLHSVLPLCSFSSCFLFITIYLSLAFLQNACC
jgi:hypothetical protein